MPAWIANAEAGDIVLSQAPNGTIGVLLASLGQTFTHSGMLLSDDRVRHNTMNADKIETDHGGQIPERLKGTGSGSLRDGSPGIITQFVGDAFDGEFHAENGLLLQGRPEAAGVRQSAADMLSGMDGFYRLFAFTDIAWPDPFLRSDDSGSMCSGSLFWSYGLASGTPWPTRSYAAEVRDPAAVTLHDAVQRKVLAQDDGFNFIQRVGQAVFGFLEGDSIEKLARNVSNQVVNCMAFDDCDNIRDRWRQGVGDGASLSPDDLRDLMTHPDFPYDHETPVTLAGGYWDCSCPQTDQGICIR
jgi:hypothetical protein